MHNLASIFHNFYPQKQTNPPSGGRVCKRRQLFIITLLSRAVSGLIASDFHRGPECGVYNLPVRKAHRIIGHTYT